MSLPKTDNAEHPNSSTSQPKSTDLTPPVKPSVVGTLDGKAEKILLK